MLKTAALICSMALFTLCPGCQSAKPNRDADKPALAATSKAWESAAQAGDWKAVAQTYTADAVLLPPNGPAVLGRDNIRQFFEHFPKFTDMKTRTVESGSHGDLAFIRGVYQMTLHIPGMAPIPDVGKFLEIHKKQPDGSWLIAEDMFSSDKMPGK